MRLREPFQAFKLASGHAIVHAGLLIGNLVIKSTEVNADGYNDEDTKDDYINTVTGVSLDDCINLIRFAHMFCIVAQLSQQILFHYEWKIAATTI